MEEDTKDLRDYLIAFRRRRGRIAAIVGSLVAISVLAAVLWPPTYRSTATILIEEQEIPAELVRSTITSYAWQRIQMINQRVMTRQNLLDITEKYSLYPGKRALETNDEIAERMRTDIKVEPMSADVMDPRSGRPMPATIAFTVSYASESPQKAQEVANEITSLYLNENVKSRTARAAETYEFLSSEATQLATQISELEGKISEFKEEHMHALPELQQLNLQILERTESEIRDTQSQIMMAERRKFELEGQLAQINPLTQMRSATGESILDPASKLKALKTELTSVRTQYSPQHPDVIRLEREIAGLEKQTGHVSSGQEQAQEIQKLRTELAQARERYSDEHPDVVRLTRQLQSLEASVRAGGSPEASAMEKPENPAYIFTQAQLNEARNSLASLARRQVDLRAKLSEVEQRLTMAPQVEKDYLNLRREYDNAQAKYREIKAKELEAKVGQSLEKESKGERFVLIDPPHMPEEPATPNRPAVLVLGLLLSFAGGFGYAAAAEGMDTTVRGIRRTAQVLNVPLLAVIPYKETMVDRVRSQTKARRIAIGIGVGFVLALIAAHFLWTPLDVLWFKGLRKVDTVIGG